MIGKILYGFVFCAIVPALLCCWAILLEPKLSALPLVQSIAAGLAIGAAGAALMLRGMWDLWRKGGGLPMNAFPPPRHVTTGAYRWFPHPIYVGFGLLVLGAAVAAGSRSGVWLVAPVTWLAMAALVLGYERISLQRRFGGPPAGQNAQAGAPSASAPGTARRVGSLFRAFLPWLVGYEACVLLGSGSHSVDTTLPFERGWPVLEWTSPVYIFTYVWAGFAPWAAKTGDDLRRFNRTAWVGTAVILWCFLALPFFAPQRPIDTGVFGGYWLALDRSLDTTACAFPSFHVFWAFAVTGLWTARLGRVLSWCIAAAISASCVTTSAHSLLDVVAGWLVYCGAVRADAIWAFLCARTERVANSWRDWRIGPVRIINHGFYAGAGTALGLWIVGLSLGASLTPQIMAVALCALVGAGVWGQWLEASSQLSRPFGYFGGLFGGCVGVVLVQVVWGQGWLVCGAFALAAPVIQAVGRLRCLVQGCCHGSPVLPGVIGIRYTRPLSRVCRIAHLDGVPVHPTPLYSIVGNLAILGLLLRLCITGVDTAFLAGAYLLLSTCARFVEEGYRGEPQTRHFGGLAIYQWLAIGCLLAGIVMTAWPCTETLQWSGFSFAPLAYALPLGALAGALMGVDFPESPRRMSRLA